MDKIAWIFIKLKDRRMINSLPYDNILDQSKLTAFAEYKINVT